MTIYIYSSMPEIPVVSIPSPFSDEPLYIEFNNAAATICNMWERNGKCTRWDSAVPYLRQNKHVWASYINNVWNGHEFMALTEGAIIDWLCKVNRELTRTYGVRRNDQHIKSGSPAMLRRFDYIRAFNNGDSPATAAADIYNLYSTYACPHRWLWKLRLKI